MTINPFTCSLSVWNGLEGYCRWCSIELAPEQKRWCSGACLTEWRLQHRYYLARQLAIKLSRRKCSCARLPGEQRHVHCNDCGLCEVIIKLRGDEITCDHIIPRRGDNSKFSCKHHQNNLQILCSTCHSAKSKSDDEIYGV